MVSRNFPSQRSIGTKHLLLPIGGGMQYHRISNHKLTRQPFSYTVAHSRGPSTTRHTTTQPCSNTTTQPLTHTAAPPPSCPATQPLTHPAAHPHGRSPTRLPSSVQGPQHQMSVHSPLVGWMVYPGSMVISFQYM